MASQANSGGTTTSVAQHNAQVGQQQLQLQQPSTTTTLQGAHQPGAQNQMQSLQVIQQSPFMPHQYLNMNQQGLALAMPSQFTLPSGFNTQVQSGLANNTIQLISTGKPLQTNQLGTQHMFTTPSYTIPTSASNNQAYFIQSPLLQQQQTGKPGEMQKVMQSQIGPATSIPTQGFCYIPQIQNPNLNLGQILLQPQRGDQTGQVFLQPGQALQNNTSTHQHFATMSLAGQLPATSISSATTNGVQQVTQQQAQVQQQVHGQQSQQQNQAQTQIATSNLVQIKAPANLQPKPPLQIQPQPAPNQQNANQNQQHPSQHNQGGQNQQQSNQQLQQQQQLTQLQHVTMSHQPQVQMIPHPTGTSQQNMLSQPLLAQTTQTLTAQVMQQAAQQGMQQAPKQFTILPNPQQIQLQPVTQLSQQQQQPTTPQPQPIRPNYSAASTASTASNQSQGNTTTATTPRPKIRKPGVGRGSNSGSPTQQGKTMFPRATIPTNISPLPPPQLKPAPSQQPTGATLTKVPVSAQGSNTQTNTQPLKTINIAALHTPNLPSNLPDATLTPVFQSGAQTQSMQQPPPQPVQVFPAATTQLPSPNISITPANPPMKKEDSSNDNSTPQAPPHSQQQQQQNNSQSQHGSEAKSENEKENAKTDTATDDPEDGSGKQKLPKALVKPQVLTHVIEGFVIQEASEPFPINRNGDSDEPPAKKIALSGEMGKCEMCGKVDLRSKFKKNKRFCSSVCAKGMKAQQQHQSQQNSQQTASVPISGMNHKMENHVKSKGKKLDGDSELTDETSSSVGEPSYMSPSINDHHEDEPKINPLKWNVNEVEEFVRSIPGCAEHSEQFLEHEIDGQALMLLKEDHLMSAMNMKLGPALKLCAKIELLKAGMMSANGDANQGKA